VTINLIILCALLEDRISGNVKGYLARGKGKWVCFSNGQMSQLFSKDPLKEEIDLDATQRHVGDKWPKLWC